jgi:hypothetical protein
MTRIALHPVKAPAVDGHDGALHIDEIVLTQARAVPFSLPTRLAKAPNPRCLPISGRQPLRWNDYCITATSPLFRLAWPSHRSLRPQIAVAVQT